MKKSVYKSYDDLLLFLNSEMVAQVLGVSPSSAYELMHEPGFPVLRIGRRMVVPKEQFIQWVKEHTGGDTWKYGNYRDGFFLPNELFQLGLDYGELAVYSFLKRCENRKTHQCWAQHQNDWTSGGHEREHSAQVHPAAGGAGTALHRVHRSGDSYRAETKRKSALHPPARSGVDRSASESCGDAGAIVAACEPLCAAYQGSGG